MNTNTRKAHDLSYVLYKLFKRIKIELSWEVKNVYIERFDTIKIPGMQILEFKWNTIDDAGPVDNCIKIQIQDFTDIDFLKLEFRMRKIALKQHQKLILCEDTYA